MDRSWVLEKQSALMKVLAKSIHDVDAQIASSRARMGERYRVLRALRPLRNGARLLSVQRGENAG